MISDKLRSVQPQIFTLKNLCVDSCSLIVSLYCTSSGFKGIKLALGIVTGQWKKPGVFNVEEFDPDPYMEALNKWGLPWKVCEDPELVKVWKANED